MKLTRVLPVVALLLIGLMVGCNKEDTNILPISTNPLNNVTGVPRNQAIEFTFSEEMIPSTINASTFILMQGDNVVAGEVTYSGKQRLSHLQMFC